MGVKRREWEWDVGWEWVRNELNEVRMKEWERGRKGGERTEVIQRGRCGEDEW